MFNIERAHSPRYTASGTIDLIVKFSGFAEEMPFHATPDDPVPHGAQLYNNALAGAYGPVAAYAPPPPPAEYAIARSTIIERLNDAGKVSQLTKYLKTHDYEREVWYALQSFKNTNALLVAMITAIGADPAEILRYDPVHR